MKHSKFFKKYLLDRLELLICTREREKFEIVLNNYTDNIQERESWIALFDKHDTSREAYEKWKVKP
jgi:hypothetical protein